MSSGFHITLPMPQHAQACTPAAPGGDTLDSSMTEQGSCAHSNRVCTMVKAGAGGCLFGMQLWFPEPHWNPLLCPNRCSEHWSLHWQQALRPSQFLLDPPQHGPPPLRHPGQCPMISAHRLLCLPVLLALRKVIESFTSGPPPLAQSLQTGLLVHVCRLAVRRQRS